MTSADIEITTNHQCPTMKHTNISGNDISLEGFPEFVTTEGPLPEELHVENTMISLREMKINAHESIWPHLKFLNVSNNDISDEGMSSFALGKWPLLEELSLKNIKITPQGIEILVKKMELLNLKRLDISENSIFDEGLRTIASGNWPLFESLIYSNTKVTYKGSITLLENFQWPKFRFLEHSLSESFYNFKKDLPKIILVIVPIDHKGRDQLAIVLDSTWLNSKQITLLINDDDLRQNLIILPRNKLFQPGHVNLSSNFAPLPWRTWSSDVKALDLSCISLSNEKDPKKLCFPNFPILESLNLQLTRITTRGLKTLLIKLDWSNLKTLNISYNPIQNEGYEALVELKCHYLEDLNFARTGLTFQGVNHFINKSNWPNLKKLDVSENEIENEGLKTLASGKWQMLETLNLRQTGITDEGIEVFINKSDWPNLRKLDVSCNKIQNEGPKILACGKWQMLEYLNLQSTEMTSEGVSVLISKECLSLKQLDVSENPIQDEGLKFLSAGKWPLLEELDLASTEITEEGIQSVVNISNWENLKKLNVSSNDKIFNKKLGSLAQGKWPLLEYLYLIKIHLSLYDEIEILVKKSSWPFLKEIRFTLERYEEISHWEMFKRWGSRANPVCINKAK